MAMIAGNYVFAPAVLVVALAGLGSFNAGPGARPQTAAPSGAEQARSEPGPAVLVEAVYPGAGAQVVADTVAAPLEQQLQGLEKALHVASRSTADGRCMLTVTFGPDVAADRARAAVQGRINLALPVLPDPVKAVGLTVREKPPGVLLVLYLFSPDQSRDTLYLSSYAQTTLQGELERVPGVAWVTLAGQHDYSLRIWLDPDKVAARKLKADDVRSALSKHAGKPPVAAGQIGQPPVPGGQVLQYSMTALARLSSPEEFANLIVKTGPGGRVVRLKDVARVELGQSAEGRALLNGRPGVVLCVYPVRGARPADVRAGVRRGVARLRQRLPDGVALEAAFDFTPNWRAAPGTAPPAYLLLDVALPDAASAQRIFQALQHGDALLRAVPGVKDVLVLTDNPFDRTRNRPCVLMRLGRAADGRAGREPLTRVIRTRLNDQMPEAAVWLRDLSRPGAFPRCGYPLDLAVLGPNAGRVRALADALAERLGKSEKLTDVRADRASRPRPQFMLDVSRDKARQMGVAVRDVFDTLQVYLGSSYVNDFNRFGRTWQVIVQAEAGRGPGNRAEDIKRLKVRNARGEMVPLAAVLTVREIRASQAVDRLDGLPLVQITANPAAGVSLPRARALCDSLAAEVRRELRLGTSYRFTWLPRE
jgi:multidrug efflux pump subunit AcrB